MIQRPPCWLSVPSTASTRPGSMPVMRVRPSQMIVIWSAPPPSLARSIGGPAGPLARTWRTGPDSRTRGRCPAGWLAVATLTGQRYRLHVDHVLPTRFLLLQRCNVLAPRTRAPLAGLGDLRAALERAQRPVALLGLRRLQAERLQRLVGKPDLQQLTGRDRVIATDHDDAREHLLQGPGRVLMAGPRAAAPATQEPP